MYFETVLPKIERIDSPSGRLYKTPVGNLYPSVTSVFSVIENSFLAEGRSRDGEKEAEKISRRAAMRGTYVHEQAEHFLKGTAAPKNNINKMLYGDMWESFKPSLEQIGDVFALEAMLYSDELEVAGTVDCVGMYEGKLSIIDFKTSSRRKDHTSIDSYWMQTAAYAQMWEERTGQQIEDLVILMAVEDDDTLIFKDLKADWLDKFKQVRYTYKGKYGR